MQIAGFFRRLLRRNKVPRLGLKRKPYVLLRHGVGETWAESEKQWLRSVFNTPTWKKLMRFSDDAIVMDVLGTAEDVEDTVDPEWVKAMVVGRKRQMDYQYFMAGMNELAASPLDEERDELPKSMVGRAQIQGDDQ